MKLGLQAHDVLLKRSERVIYTITISRNEAMREICYYYLQREVKRINHDHPINT